MRYRAGEMIVLAQYDPAWSCEFAREAERLTAALDDLQVELHHIGSTAVPELIAKPVIDVLAVAPTVDALDTRGETFRALGYQVMGEFGIPGRRYFRKDDSAGRRTHQIHAFAEGSTEIRRHLDFRDYLRAHPAVAKAYGTLKQTLAGKSPSDMECYSDGKTAFIRDVEQRAAICKRGLDASFSVSTSHNGTER
ncbi:MAG: GrpB family protein [Gemmatimonadaceae bacterium]